MALMRLTLDEGKKSLAQANARSGDAAEVLWSNGLREPPSAHQPDGADASSSAPQPAGLGQVLRGDLQPGRPMPGAGGDSSGLCSAEDAAKQAMADSAQERVAPAAARDGREVEREMFDIHELDPEMAAFLQEVLLNGDKEGPEGGDGSRGHVATSAAPPDGEKRESDVSVGTMFQPWIPGRSLTGASGQMLEAEDVREAQMLTEAMELLPDLDAVNEKLCVKYDMFSE